VDQACRTNSCRGVSAFVLTSVVMFWLPFLEPLTGRWYLTSVTDYEYIDTFYPYADALKKLSPAEERGLFEEIENELKQKPNGELFRLKAFEDILTRSKQG
jgi:hypothetical protein